MDEGDMCQVRSWRPSSPVGMKELSGALSQMVIRALYPSCRWQWNGMHDPLVATGFHFEIEELHVSTNSAFN